jgi:hypothetical protein
LANYIFVDGYLLLNAVNMSAMAKKITLKTSVVEQPNTAFGSAGYTSVIGGLKGFSLDLDFNQDMAASQVDQLLFPLLGTVTSFEVRATSAAASTTNPAYRGSVLVKDYTPFDGSVGDLADLSVSWTGTGQLLRQTT